MEFEILLRPSKTLTWKCAMTLIDVVARSHKSSPDSQTPKCTMTYVDVVTQSPEMYVKRVAWSPESILETCCMGVTPSCHSFLWQPQSGLYPSFAGAFRARRETCWVFVPLWTWERHSWHSVTQGLLRRMQKCFHGVAWKWDSTIAAGGSMHSC